MESRAKFLGHPVHPMLVVFPLGLLGAAWAFDLAAWITGRELLAAVGFWNILGGVGMGLLAAVFGLVDFLHIPRRTRAWRVGLVHGLGNVVVVALFAASAFVRWENPMGSPGGLPLVLETAAFLLAGVTGWLGGELVDRMGVGVDTAAHLNSPSSLSGREAREDFMGSAAPKSRETHPLGR